MIKITPTFKTLFLLPLLALLMVFPVNNNARASGDITTRPSTPHQETPPSKPVPKQCGGVCLCNCQNRIEQNHVEIRDHKSEEFRIHRRWMVDVYWKQHILPAMMQMVSQFTAGAMQQVLMIGQFFDAKHQLETQAIFQEMMAEAHRDYMPSEGLCEIGTSTRSLAASQRKTVVAHAAFSKRLMDRQLLAGDTSSSKIDSDMLSRIDLFVRKHCHKDDNAEGLGFLCAQGGEAKEQRNKDVDFTRTLESKLTVDVDFTNEGQAETTADEEDLFALSANLFGHDPLIFAPRITLATDDGQARVEATRYLDLRSVAAKRSVAQNSFSAIVAERASGSGDVAPYLNKIMEELGVTDINDIEEILGKNPSYFAQMEVMTKKMVQNPVFYTELYDKPANVLRKQAALRAVNLMQERDLYKSQLRQEAVLSIVLELMLHEEQDRVNAKIEKLQPGGEPAFE
jgi:hypothetical protein